MSRLRIHASSGEGDCPDEVFENRITEDDVRGFGSGARDWDCGGARLTALAADVVKDQYRTGRQAFASWLNGAQNGSVVRPRRL